MLIRLYQAVIQDHKCVLTVLTCWRDQAALRCSPSSRSAVCTMHCFRAALLVGATCEHAVRLQYYTRQQEELAASACGWQCNREHPMHIVTRQARTCLAFLSGRHSWTGRACKLKSLFLAARSHSRASMDP